uniref:Uncharacterized protein n=1 Tax=Oryza glaberrima TaxID=4538 RepID=I1PSI8_ORYGL
MSPKFGDGPFSHARMKFGRQLHATRLLRRPGDRLLLIRLLLLALRRRRRVQDRRVVGVGIGIHVLGDVDEVMRIVEGRDCGAENTLKPGDVIQCRECGYRILYKKRTRRTYGLTSKVHYAQIENAIAKPSSTSSVTTTDCLFNMKRAEDMGTSCDISVSKAMCDDRILVKLTDFNSLHFLVASSPGHCCSTSSAFKVMPVVLFCTLP